MRDSELEAVRERALMEQAILDVVLEQLESGGRRDEKLYSLVAAARACATRNIASVAALIALLTASSAA